MPEYADIYVLSEARNRAAIDAFLDAFVVEREEAADEYEVPQYSDSPKCVFQRAGDLVDYCCSNPREVHAIYWRSVGGAKPEYAMVFFLSDEHIVFGISTDGTEERSVRILFERLKQHFDSDEALLCYETGPPESADAFREEVRKNA